MAHPQNVEVSLEFTPSPNTLKYSVNRVLLPQGNLRYGKVGDAQGRSPLAEALFAVQGVAQVQVSRDTITVVKTEAGDWDEIHQHCVKAIEKHLGDGGQVLTDSAQRELEERLARGPSAEDLAIRKKIEEVIDQEIRPRLQMDGGDIRLEKFEDGIVYVELEGACRGCPGARMTLKMGVERRLCEAIPEVREVVAL